MAKEIKQNIEKKYTLPIIQLDDGNKIPLLPLYLLAALKNDRVIMKNLENREYGKYYKLHGIYDNYGTLNFSAELTFDEKILTPKQYVQMVIGQYLDDSYYTLKNLLNLMSLSKFLFISILFLLDNRQISLYDIKKYSELQVFDIFDEVIEKLELFKEITYLDYVDPIDVAITEMKMKLEDFYICNICVDDDNITHIKPFSIDVVGEEDGVGPIILSSYSSTTRLPPPKASDAYSSISSPDISNPAFTDDENMYSYTYKNLTAIFPLFRQVTDSSEDFFKSMSSTKTFYDKQTFRAYCQKYKTNFDNRLTYCSNILYIQTSDQNAKYRPEIKFINLLEYDNFYISTHGGNTTYTMSEFIDTFSLYTQPYALLIKYKDIEIIYLIKLEFYSSILGDDMVYYDIMNALFSPKDQRIKKLNNIFIDMEEALNNRFKNNVLTIDGIYNSISSSFEGIDLSESISIIDKEKNGEIYLDLTSDVTHVYLSPNNSYLEYADDVMDYIFLPDIQLNINFSNLNPILLKVAEKIENFDELMDGTGKLSGFELGIAPQAYVLYKIYNIYSVFNPKISIVCSYSRLVENILHHTSFNIEPLNINIESLKNIDDVSGGFDVVSVPSVSVNFKTHDALNKSEVDDEGLYYYENNFYLDRSTDGEEVDHK